MLKRANLSPYLVREEKKGDISNQTGRDTYRAETEGSILDIYEVPFHLIIFIFQLVKMFASVLHWFNSTLVRPAKLMKKINGTQKESDNSIQ